MMKYCFILLLVIMCGCGSAKFIVTCEEPTGILDNCNIDLKAISPKAERISKRIDGAMVRCGEYQVGDTLILNKKEFTNF